MRKEMKTRRRGGRWSATKKFASRHAKNALAIAALGATAGTVYHFRDTFTPETLLYSLIGSAIINSRDEEQRKAISQMMSQLQSNVRAKRDAAIQYLYKIIGKEQAKV